MVHRANSDTNRATRRGLLVSLPFMFLAPIAYLITNDLAVVIVVLAIGSVGAGFVTYQELSSGR